MHATFDTINGQIRAQHADGKDLIYSPNALSSLTSVRDEDGTRAAEFTPFGQGSPPPGAIFGWVGAWGYRPLPSQLSGYYVRARHYSPSTAGWTSQDPLWPREPAFSYLANPVSLIDPSGLACQEKCCCDPVLLWPTPPPPAVTLSNEPSHLNPRDPLPRYGTNFGVFFLTAYKESLAGGDCTLEWHECSNFPLTKNYKIGTWLTRNTATAFGFEDWYKRRFNCNITSGTLHDEPSLTTQRIKEVYQVIGEKTRHLFITVRIRGGGGKCVEAVELHFYQSITYDVNGDKVDFQLGWPTGLIGTNGLCVNPP